MFQFCRDRLGIVPFAFVDVNPATFAFINGFAVAPFNAVAVFDGVGTRYHSGLMFTQSGQLCVAVNGTPHHYVSGLPITADDRLCITDSNVLDADVWVAGARVTRSGGKEAVAARTDHTVIVPGGVGYQTTDVVFYASSDGAEYATYGMTP